MAEETANLQARSNYLNTKDIEALACLQRLWVKHIAQCKIINQLAVREDTVRVYECMKVQPTSLYICSSCSFACGNVVEHHCCKVKILSEVPLKCDYP
jgi:hypothetical protein